MEIDWVQYASENPNREKKNFIKTLRLVGVVAVGLALSLWGINALIYIPLPLIVGMGFLWYLYSGLNKETFDSLYLWLDKKEESRLRCSSLPPSLIEEGQPVLCMDMNHTGKSCLLGNNNWHNVQQKGIKISVESKMPPSVHLTRKNPRTLLQLLSNPEMERLLRTGSYS